MRYKIYGFLVNRHEGIKERYHNMHDKAVGFKKVMSWVYLLWLNICYYLFFCRFLGRRPELDIYEEKRLLVEESESAAACRMIDSVESMVEKLSGYDVISFDIFDTLIFRPFSDPEDVFYYVGHELGFMNFKQLRGDTENQARIESLKERGTAEITLGQIWERISQETGISADIGLAIEIACEKKFCYANPFMYKVYEKLRSMGKRMIAVSDMYLDSETLRQILDKCGYAGFENIYVSCEYGRSKADKGLYSIVRKKYDKCKCVHVGDNLISDVKHAKQSGFDSVYYPNVNINSLKYRAYDMSPIIGGAYRGIVDNHLYCGLRQYSMEYEYGFIYGGLFVLGYCGFIHNYVRENGIDKVLFLSRDGHILSKVYEKMYGADNIAYVYWSRSAAAKLMADYNRYDYFRRFLYHKANKGITIEEILKSAGLHELIGRLPENISPESYLTDSNADEVKCFVIENWERVVQIYSIQQEMTKEYYNNILKGCKKACAVDIGWAGSGAVSLDFLCRNVWNIPCEVYGLVAGTNTLYNAEPDASETFLQSGKLAAYMFSQNSNRDIMKKHDLNKGYNLYWELLVSSPVGTFKSFTRNAEGKLEAVLAEPDVDESVVEEIWQGIIDFVEEYRLHFEDCAMNEYISGRDAYAPMLVAAGKNEKYLKHIIDGFRMNIDVV